MNYMVTDIASLATFLAGNESRPATYRAKFFLAGPDIAVSVTHKDMQTFVDSVSVTDGAQ